MAGPLRPGERFAGCKIISLCGKGAFGTTYWASDPLERRVIIKILSSGLCSDRELAGLRNYMRISGKHPNLLRISHIGETDHCFYYIMEAADNCGSDAQYLPATLGNRIKLEGRLAPGEAIRVLRELLDALRFMHGEGMIHRDIKPDNIIFVDGKAKLSDPGLVAEAGSSVTFAGTLGFIPPETLKKPGKPDPRHDLYALGKVFYCMITGSAPDQYPQFPMDLRIEVCRQLYPVLNRACNRNPAKRFKNVEDFLGHLPEQLAAPTRLERLREDFRSWRMLNPERWRAILCAIGVMLLLLTAAGAVLLVHRHREQEALGRCRLDAENFARTAQGREELLDFQIQVYLPELCAEYRKRFGTFETARNRGDWRSAARLGGELRDFLGRAAERLLPEIPDKPGDFKQDFAAAGLAHSFLAAPLASYLDAAARDGFKRRLARHETALYQNWSGPRCGRSWESQQEYYMPLSFIPAGAVRMLHSGEVVRIPYGFWLCKKELTHEPFTRNLSIAPQMSALPNTPVERVLWNDILYFCRVTTIRWRTEGILPPGFIVRPPTEAEWEFAAKNGWLGPDETPFTEREVCRENSGNHTWAPASRAPNKLGLFDMGGNVREIVIPQTPPATENFVVMRGGSFRLGEKQSLNRQSLLKYQNMLPDIGFRLAVAPGDMDFFDRNFFAHDINQFRTRGKVYELLGGNLSAFDWETSDALCRLLGGRLAEFENRDHLDDVRKNLPLAGAWDTFIGGKKSDGQWRWLHSGKIIDWGSWKKKRGAEDGDKLAFNKTRWFAVSQTRSGTMLCEWDEEEFARRNRRLRDQAPLPFEVKRFAVGDRTFVLFQLSLFCYTADRVCTLLGGRLACLDTPEVRDRVIEAVRPWQDHNILLGGYAKWGSWFWMNGKEINLPLSKDGDHVIPTRNRNFVSLRGGQFYDSQYARLFLCEWSASSESPCSR